MPEAQGREPLSIITFPPSPATPGHDGGKLRAAAYCRVSTGSKEQLTSYLRQVRHYSQYLDEQPNYINSGIYADEGISGTGIGKRQGFLKMMDDCREGKLDLIITKSVSRFGRNTVDCLVSTRELKTLGIDVFFEKENIHTLTAEGEVLLSLIAAVAENESVAMSENVQWGLRRKYETGSVKSIPLGKCLGYRKDEEGQIVIVEEEAAVVRRIYQEFLDGLSVTEIAAGLEKDGIRTDQGNTAWSLSTIRKILRNELAKGDFMFQKTFNQDPLTKRRLKNKGELPKYYLEGSHPGIVARETWECVRLEIERQEAYCREHRITKYHHHNKENPLSARITCATCGSTYMQLRSKKAQDEGRVYWRCSSFRGGRGKPVKGRTFTPPPMALWSKVPESSHRQYYRKNKRKMPVPRQMFCTDIQVPAEVADKAFMHAWNFLVSHGLRYMSSFREMARDEKDELVRYRARELGSLLQERGRIRKLDYGLMNKVLDHIEVTADGKLAVIFRTGTRVTI